MTLAEKRINNTLAAMMRAQDPKFREYWSKVYLHLVNQYSH